ncbi:hypothetical protein MGYG_07302 [Nannizzia gypsea CBS 118893]|uniref:Uncharacterized protein n=1 Tax=Arthroderma gypseum (strain ATCC MYA-4604 / CBS 118893) TaxID=535722 RepID=E4V2S1_ARTGP|nr:hypothetical protein MGYG_07302 [Nannizzia gypsea CBS 118893]EFR04295.1 hypothetical protein MGYG_07302 [Nannizzia gypsea CBS 118893]
MFRCEEQDDTLNHALLGVLLGLSNARIRLMRLQKILDDNPTAQTTLSGVDRSALYTFESLYGDYLVRDSTGDFRGRTTMEHVKSLAI